MVASVPSRFIAEMKLHEVQEKVDLRQTEGAARGGGGARRRQGRTLEHGARPARARIGADGHRRRHRAAAVALLFVAKPLTTVLLIVRAMGPRGHDEPRVRRWILAGLVLSLVGDVALLWPEQGFLPGLIAFLLAFGLHRGLLVRRARFGSRRAPFAAYAIVAGAVLMLLWPGVPPRCACRCCSIDLPRDHVARRRRWCGWARAASAGRAHRRDRRRAVRALRCAARHQQVRRPAAARLAVGAGSY